VKIEDILYLPLQAKLQRQETETRAAQQSSLEL